MDKNAKMARRLSCMFEYQRFADNERLAAMHEDVIKRYGQMLSDDDLELVSAAGTTDVPPQDGEKQ